MATIQITVKGVDEFIKDYDKFKNDMKNNMIVPLDESAAQYLKVISANFSSEGTVFGEKWPPLSLATIRAKKSEMSKGKAISLKPLIRTGKMKAGFGRDTRGKNQAYVYNTQSYSIIHQEGRIVEYHGRPVQVPRRVLAEVDDARIQMVVDVFAKWFNDIVSRNKL